MDLSILQSIVKSHKFSYLKGSVVVHKLPQPYSNVRPHFQCHQWQVALRQVVLRVERISGWLLDQRNLAN